MRLMLFHLSCRDSLMSRSVQHCYLFPSPLLHIVGAHRLFPLPPDHHVAIVHFALSKFKDTPDEMHFALSKFKDTPDEMGERYNLKIMGIFLPFIQLSLCFQTVSLKKVYCF